jgi:hypothetical protein
MRILLLTLLTAASPFSWAIVTSETEAAARKLGASTVGEVEFNAGQTGLDDDAKNDLNDLKKEAEQAGAIEEIRVIAWADKEYPIAEQKRYTRADIRLADERAQNVKNYLERDLHLKSITTYNMAKRPNLLQEMLKTPGAAIKDTLEKSGAAPHSEADTGLFAEKSKSSTALILVYKKRMKDNKLIRQ